MSYACTAAIPYISELAPIGELFDFDGEEFERRCRERLDAIGVDRIEQRFHEGAAEHDGRPLVLLCFESAPVATATAARSRSGGRSGPASSSRSSRCV